MKEILVLKERIEREILPRFTQRRQDNAQRLLKQMYERPVLDVKDVTKLLKTAPNTAGKLIDDFVGYGLLREITGQHRHRLFVFQDYLALFKK